MKKKGGRASGRSDRLTRPCDFAFSKPAQDRPLGPGCEHRMGQRKSRHLSPFFPLSRHGPAGSNPTAESADRAVLYDFRRVSAGIRAAYNPLSRFVREHEGDVEPPVDPVRHLQKRLVFLIGQHDPNGVLLDGRLQAFQRIRCQEQATLLVPRPGGPIQDRDQKPQVAFDHSVRHGLPARTHPARPALPDEPIPIALGECLRPSVRSQEPEEHPHRDPVALLRPLRLGGRHLFAVDFKKPFQRERLGLGLAVGLVRREACGGLVGLPLCPRPVPVLQGPGEPASVLSPLNLVETGLGIGEHPHPVPAPLAGAVAAPVPLRACHHSIPFAMDRTICANETSLSGVACARSSPARSHQRLGP